ncbi:MAG TPA: hypothetical protein VHZ24_19560, partial [Pirellulales bacterium]|nr:hypothetical protein [Pirellulales bacterium]
MHPLTRKLAALRRRAYLLLLGHALAWTVAIVLAVGMVLGLLDWIIHFQDRGLRIIASGVVLATLLIFSWRLIWRALRTRFSDLDLALRIERRFPKFRDQLASTVQFLRQRDDGPEAGSAAMRREVIHQAMVDIEHVDLDETIDLRPVLRGAIAMSIVLAVVAVLGVAAPGSLRTAGLRLLAPLGDTAWPKANHLAFVDPVHRLASGERFEVALADAEGAKLPNEVRIHYRFETSGDEPQERVELMRPGRGTLIAAIESVARPFQYRAEGGDDDSMPWQTLAVVEPPIPEQFELTLHYPAYTGWRPSSSEPHLRALVGTRVAIVGRANKPLSSAVLRFDNAPEIPLAITPDGYGFDMAADAKPGFVVEKADAFVLDLADREQFHGGRETRYAVHAIEDRTPTVSLEEPAADIYMTADAVVPAHVLAKDDLAIRSVELRWSRSDHSDQPDTVFPLYAGPPAIEPSDAADTAAPGHGEARNLEHRWNLAELQLKPGAKLSLFASATDYRGATAQSHPRRLSIITPDELQDRLTERQGAILNELGRMLKLERESRAQVSGVQIQLDHVGRLNKHDADQLQQAELTQRQVERGLGRRGEGIPAQLQGLLDELRNNRVANGEVENRLNQALEEIDRIGREHLPPIARELTSALKAAQEGQQPATEEKGDGVKPDTAKPQQQAGKPEARVGRSLAAAGQQQDATIGALEQLLQNLTEWDNYRRFHRDIGQLRREQDELARETATQGATTLTQELKDLKPQQLADLKKLGSRQMDLARNFEKVQDRMQQMAEQLRQSDPLTSETINDALHEARQKTLGGQMRSAGREIEQNQVGQAGAAQQQVMQGLDELLDILSNRRERELGRLVKKLRESEQQMQQLRQQQAGLRKKLEENARRDESP